VALLEEQKSYYEARATEYDEWWERRGRYDLGAEGNALWREEIQKVEAVFDMAPLRGHVLEPAAGSGNWTLYLTRRAEKVTVLDNSRSMIERNRRRVQEAGFQGRVDYEETDLFCWHPGARYDAIFLGFWVSHLPSAVLDPFLLLMASALKPGGCLAILEGQRNGRLRSATQGTSRLDDEIELRTLNDGRTFRIVKRYDDPEDLAERLERAGLNAQVGASGEQFLYALAFSPS
jgi:demethylmenaquinone methyltransferase/2-methoxy-6-polyprenyl-1,4-benzoquinol methylase